MRAGRNKTLRGIGSGRQDRQKVRLGRLSARRDGGRNAGVRRMGKNGVPKPFKKVKGKGQGKDERKIGKERRR
jgi:hypothetical protein